MCARLGGAVCVNVIKLGFAEYRLKCGRLVGVDGWLVWTVGWCSLRSVGLYKRTLATALQSCTEGSTCREFCVSLFFHSV